MLRTRTILAVVLCSTLFAQSLSAQTTPTDPGATKLAQLLAELQGMPGTAWQTRVKELEGDITAQKAKAAKLRGKAADLQAQAAAADQRAAAIAAEIQRLGSLQTLMAASATAPRTTPKQVAKAAGAAQAAAKKPAAKKPAAKKPAAKKPVPKNPDSQPNRTNDEVVQASTRSDAGRIRKADTESSQADQRRDLDRPRTADPRRTLHGVP